MDSEWRSWWPGVGDVTVREDRRSHVREPGGRTHPAGRR